MVVETLNAGTDPGIVMMAGDWHGDRRWATARAWDARKLEAPRIVLQLGDFGFWPYRQKEWKPGETHPEALRYLEDLQGSLQLADAEIWVTPGNHDNYDQINQWLADNPADRVQVPGFDRIYVLRRGARWVWHGRTWLSVGGAVSVDRIWARRMPRVDWWPEEEVTAEQADAVIAAGHADVMLTHDYPARVIHAHHRGPEYHPQDLERSNVHNARMQLIVDGVQPSYYMHGHLHQKYGRTYDWGWGPVQVSGLGMNGDEAGNTALLDTRTMEWQ